MTKHTLCVVRQTTYHPNLSKMLDTVIRWTIGHLVSLYSSFLLEKRRFHRTSMAIKYTNQQYTPRFAITDIFLLTVFKLPYELLYRNQFIRDLVCKLTIKDPCEREQSFSGDFKNIKKDVLFDTTDWGQITSKSVPAPFLPNLSYPEDTKYFDDLADIPLRYSGPLLNDKLSDFDSLFKVGQS